MPKGVPVLPRAATTAPAKAVLEPRPPLEEPSLAATSRKATADVVRLLVKARPNEHLLLPIHLVETDQPRRPVVPPTEESPSEHHR